MTGQEGDMMGEAWKLVWNSWEVLKKDTGGSMETGWVFDVVTRSIKLVSEPLLCIILVLQCSPELMHSNTSNIVLSRSCWPACQPWTWLLA